MAFSVLTTPANNSVNSIYSPIKIEAEVDDTSGSLALVRMSLRLHVGGSYINNNNPIIQDPDLDQTGATGSHTKFTFDISEILRNYFTHDLQAQGFEAGASATNSMKTIGLFYGAIYKNTSTNVLTESSTLSKISSSDTFYCVNSALQHLETQTMAAYTLGSDTKRLLTPFLADEKIKIKTSESYQLSGIYTGSTPDYKIWVNVHKSGASSEEFYIDVASVGTRFDVGVGCSNFANLVGGDMHSSNTGSLPIIESNATMYDVVLYDGSTQISGRYRFDIDKKTHQYSTRLTWKNRLGGFDSWTFDGASSRGQNQSKELYDKNLDFGFSSTDRESSVLSVRSTNVFSAWSGIIQEYVRKALEELYTSPEVYLVDSTSHVPIQITDSQVKTIDDNANLFQVKVNYAYSFENVINV
ncbi:hypothetical protein [uncultured Mediterranean phage uvDeep-CGR2-KM21-C345]|nr:hypothetical protein [uncultured Mediterranean phage uvDeep-CGR2-KM21-C345]